RVDSRPRLRAQSAAARIGPQADVLRKKSLAKIAKKNSAGNQNSSLAILARVSPVFRRLPNRQLARLLDRAQREARVHAGDARQPREMLAVQALEVGGVCN